MKKKLMVCLLIAIMAATMGLTACGGGGSSSGGGGGEATPAGGGDTLKVVDAEWYGIDVYQLDSSSNFQSLCSESLFEWDNDTMDIADGVLTNWEVSEDGKTATFTVPKGRIYPVTGEEMLAEDVVASIEHGKKVSPYADGYANIESMDYDNETGQVTLHLSSFRSDMLYNMSSDFMCIIDKDELDTMSDEELMWGCHPYGMYYLDNYVSGSEVTLKRNDAFVTDSPLVENKGAAHFETVICQFNVEDFTALESLKNGDVQMLCSIGADTVAELEGNDSVVIEDTSYPDIDFIEINTTNKTFKDNYNLRLAFCLLVDREALCELTDGSAVPAYSMIFDTMQNFNQEAKDYFIENFANDKEKAHQLIEGEGYTKNAEGYYEKDGKVLELDFYCSSSSLPTVIAEGLQGMMQDEGIKINLSSIDWNYVHEQAASDDYDIVREGLGWAEPILILNTCYYDKNAPGATQEYYDFVSEIAQTVDSDERTEKVGEIQKKMYENLDIIPLYSEKGFMAHSTALTGYKIQSDGTYSFNDVRWAE